MHTGNIFQMPNSDEIYLFDVIPSDHGYYGKDGWVGTAIWLGVGVWLIAIWPGERCPFGSSKPIPWCAVVIDDLLELSTTLHSSGFSRPTPRWQKCQNKSYWLRNVRYTRTKEGMQEIVYPQYPELVLLSTSMGMSFKVGLPG